MEWILIIDNPNEQLILREEENYYANYLSYSYSYSYGTTDKEAEDKESTSTSALDAESFW